MSHLRWGPGIEFRKLVLEPEPDDRRCAHCGEFTHIYEHRDRRLYLLTGATHLVSKIAHCMDKECPGHQEVVESAAEMGLAPPFWTIGWDVFAWMGHRRFARNWSVPQIRERRQLLLPVSDNYFCRFRPRPSSRPTALIFTTHLG